MNPTPTPSEPTLTSADLLAKLPIAAGPMAGAKHLVVQTAAVATVCGGTDVWVEAKPTKAPGLFTPGVVAALTMRFPADLDFTRTDQATPPPGKVQLDAWLELFKNNMSQARTELVAAVKAGGSTEALKTEAVAINALLSRRAAELFVRASIPVNVRTIADAPAVYCDTIANKAEPLLVDMEQNCAAIAGSTGWWTVLCQP
jgi:hypothetical protein